MKHCLVVPSLFLALLSVVRGETPTVVAIKDAHIVTVAGADLPKATVILRNGLIEQVGADINVAPDAWVIDGAGLTVYPGFIDALSTWGIPTANAPAGGSAGTAGGASASSPAAVPPIKPAYAARKIDLRPIQRIAQPTWLLRRIAGWRRPVRQGLRRPRHIQIVASSWGKAL